MKCVNHYGYLWFHAYISTILCLTLSRLSNNNGDPGFLSEWSWKFGIAFVDLLQNSILLNLILTNMRFSEDRGLSITILMLCSGRTGLCS